MTDSARYLQFWRFVRSEPKPDNGTAFMDPRNTADQLCDDDPFVQHEPVIAVLHRGRPSLIDGYLRSILFYRHGRTDQRLSAWVPERKSSPMVHRAGDTPRRRPYRRRRGISGRRPVIRRIPVSSDVHRRAGSIRVDGLADAADPRSPARSGALRRVPRLCQAPPTRRPPPGRGCGRAWPSVC